MSPNQMVIATKVVPQEQTRHHSNGQTGFNPINTTSIPKNVQEVKAWCRQVIDHVQMTKVAGDPSLIWRVVTTLLLGGSYLISGPTGSSKTYPIVETLKAVLVDPGRQLKIFNCTNSVLAHKILGYFDDDGRYVPGLFRPEVQAYVFDEFGSLPPAMQRWLLSILDDRVIRIDGQEAMTLSDQVSFYFTCNNEATDGGSHEIVPPMLGRMTMAAATPVKSNSYDKLMGVVNLEANAVRNQPKPLDYDIRARLQEMQTRTRVLVEEATRDDEFNRTLVRIASVINQTDKFDQIGLEANDQSDQLAYSIETQVTPRSITHMRQVGTLLAVYELGHMPSERKDKVGLVASEAARNVLEVYLTPNDHAVRRCRIRRFKLLANYVLRATAARRQPHHRGW